jgi:two-component system sensor kinase FixL
MNNCIQMDPIKPQFSDEKQLTALMDAMVEAFIIIDERGIIERYNKAAQEMFGWSVAEAVGQNVTLLMPPADGDAHGQYIENYQRTGKKKIIGTGREVIARRKDGSSFSVDLAVGEVRMRNAVRYISLIRDITERKLAAERATRRQDEMIRTSRLTTMGEMAAAMAHELNQPLTAISNYANACARMIDKGKPDSGDIRSTMKLIDDQAHRAGEVIKRLRNFVKYDQTTRETVRLDALVGEIISLAVLDARANDILFEFTIPNDLPELVVDQIQIQQVILNLLRNGVDAMVSNDDGHRHLLLTAKQTGPEDIRVEVIDEGPGVPDNVRDSLFNAFFTTKDTGMGMGLAICRTIIQAHGGKLDFMNNDNGGATFYFTLPTGLGDELS